MTETDMRSTNQLSSIHDQFVDLIGGLALIPYGIYALISALVFAVGLLDWDTNGGPPFLGILIALLLDKLIRRSYYRRKYGFSFDSSSQDSDESKSDLKTILGITIFAVVLIAWFVDARAYFSVRLLPLVAGLLVCWRGATWVKKGWREYGWVHLGLGILPLGLSLLPLILNTGSNNLYLGLDGVLELTCIGIITVVVAIMEHRLFLRMYGTAQDSHISSQHQTAAKRMIGEPR